jgi:hypothetical protein
LASLCDDDLGSKQRHTCVAADDFAAPFGAPPIRLLRLRAPYAVTHHLAR